MAKHPSLEKKVRDFKNHLIKKKFEYKQRNHANGVWGLLKKYLALSDEMMEISEDTKLQLIGKKQVHPIIELHSAGGRKVTVFSGSMDLKKDIDGTTLDKDWSYFIHASESHFILLLFSPDIS